MSNAKTILIVTRRFYPDTFDGSGRVVYEQGRRLAARGYRVLVVTPRIRPNLLPEDTILGMHVFRYRGTGWQKFLGQSFADLKAGRAEIERLAAKFSIDFAILHHTFPAAAYFRAGLAKKIPAIYVFHASLYRELRDKGASREVRFWPLGKTFIFFLKRLAKKYEGEIFSRVRRIVVFSDYSRRILAETYPGAERKAVKISVGVNEDYLNSMDEEDAAREKLNLPTDRPIIFVVRRLTPRMGLGSLISAMSEIVKKRPDVLLLMAGDGPLFFELGRQIRANKLEDNIKMLGKITDEELRLYYRAADLFVLPTLSYEGLGLATLEALASGLPALGTSVGATPEILESLDPELVIPGGSPATIAKKILWFLDEKLGDEGLRLASRELARNNYSWQKSVTELDNIIQEIIS